jgi:chemotaxis signal transduction protein
MLVVVAASAGRSELALWVDEVLAVRALPASRIQEAADRLRGLPPEMVRGVCDRPELAGAPAGDGLLVVLNLPALLAAGRLIIEEELE